MEPILLYSDWKQTRKKKSKNYIRLTIHKFFYHCEKIVNWSKTKFTFIIIKYPFIEKITIIIQYSIIKIKNWYKIQFTFIISKLKFIKVILKLFYDLIRAIRRIIFVYSIYKLYCFFSPSIEAEIIKWFPNQTDCVFLLIEKAKLVIQAKKQIAVASANPSISFSSVFESNRFIATQKNLFKLVYPYIKAIIIAAIIRRF